MTGREHQQAIALPALPETEHTAAKILCFAKGDSPELTALEDPRPGGGHAGIPPPHRAGKMPAPLSL